MNFQVPQFIETEDKIIGPLTLRQFFYVAAGGVLSFFLFFFLQSWLWILVTFFIAVISASFAFIKINGRPLTVIVTAAIGFYWKPRMFLWERKEKMEKEAGYRIPELKMPPFKSKLNDLWDQLKTSKNPVPKREKPFQPTITDREKSSKERFEVMRKITGEKELAKRIDYR